MLKYLMLKPHSFTVDDFMVMVNAGLFEDQRVELLGGMIVDMSPPDPKHEFSIDVLTEKLAHTFYEQALVRVQNSVDVELPEWLPQPDVALVQRRDYSVTRPKPADIFLLIEVANTSLKLLGRKRSIYARVGIKNYWVADISAERWTIHREPKGERYETVFEVPFGEAFAPLAFPEHVHVWL